jgi:hypothetical protein
MIIIGLLSGVSILTGLLPPFTSNTSAATVYDGAYVTTDDLIINTDYYSFNCGSTDITTTWKDKILNDANWSSSAYGINDRDNAQSSFETALNQGAWAVTKHTWIESGEAHRQRDMVEVTWVENTSDAHIEFADAGTFYATQVAGNNIWKVVIATEKAWTPTGSGTCDPKVITAYKDNSSQWISVPLPDDGGSMYRRENFLASNWTLNTPLDYESYEGAQIRDDQDGDGDGLSLSRELTQGTSDVAGHQDTDSDGIDDLKESQWYSNRNDVFCKSDLSYCAYPNPIAKDLYVEIDWMNDGTQDYKPTTTQLNTVVNTLENKGILAHFDTGQLGGGETLPSLSEPLVFAPTEDKIDFYDLKNGTSSIDRQFADNRIGIWHYMITGKNFTKEFDDTTAIPGSTGAAYPGDDDSMISIEMLEDDFPSSTPRNKAISGTILHELGHNLCLTHTEQYDDQSSECVYEGIDNASGSPPLNSPDAYYNLANYESVMNYRYQLADQYDMGSIDYSDNTHGTGDHNDWGAVMTGMDDFIYSSDPEESTFQRRGGIIRQLQD